MMKMGRGLLGWLLLLAVFGVEYVRSQTPLVVLAGSSRLAWLPDATVVLQGSTVNYSEPQDTLDVEWSVEHAPEGVDTAEVVIQNASSLSGATATFLSAGGYVLICNVSVLNGSGGVITSDFGRMVVEVYEETENFGGYDLDFLKDRFTGDMGLKYDFNNFDYERMTPPPAYGVHPRLYINPDQVDTLRDNLQNTVPGVKLMTKIVTQLNLIRTGAQWLTAIEELNKGSAKNLDLISADDHKFVGYVGYEIFRAFVEQDTAAGVLAVDIMAMICEKQWRTLKYTKASKYENAFNQWNKFPQQRQRVRADYREYLQGIAHRKVIATAYDFGHGFMTEAKREKFRKILLEATTPDIWSIGLDSLPVRYGMTSNWITTSTELLIMTCAVEGETSTKVGNWNGEMFARTVAMYERYIGIGFHEDGTSYEGMGKNQLGANALIILAKRRIPLIASHNVKNHVRNFYAYSMFPWGRNNDLSKPSYAHWSFTWDEAIGGTRQPSRYEDVVTIQWAFPGDKVMNLVARAEMSDTYSQLFDFNMRVYYKAMVFWNRATVCQDIDTSMDWNSMYVDAMGNRPKTFFSDDRGLAIMVTEWDRDAMQLHFAPRHLRGGHAHYDRNKFCLYALGATWIECTGSNNNHNDYHAVVKINDESKQAGLVGAKTVAKLDTDLASFYAGDARLAYGDVTGLPIALPGKQLYTQFRPLDHNDHRFTPDFYNGDIPKRYLPYWKDGIRRYRNSTATIFETSMDSIGNYPDKAFRTAGLVRGQYPYALVLDDIKKDGQEQDYTWMAPIYRFAVRNDAYKSANFEYDEATETVRVKDPHQPGRMFMLKFIDYVNSAGTAPTMSWNTRFKSTMNMKVTAVEPKFKVFMYAYKEEDPLPELSFSNNVLTVQFRVDSAIVQDDRFEFSENIDGRTVFKLYRNNGGSEELFDFENGSEVSPSGSTMRIPTLQTITDPLPASPNGHAFADFTANSFTRNWETQECVNNYVAENCEYPHGY